MAQPYKCITGQIVLSKIASGLAKASAPLLYSTTIYVYNKVQYLPRSTVLKYLVSRCFVILPMPAPQSSARSVPGPPSLFSNTFKMYVHRNSWVYILHFKLYYKTLNNKTFLAAKCSTINH